MLIYASQHLEVAPGYPNGDATGVPTQAAFRDQAMLSSNSSGQTAAIGTPGFPYGPYLSRIPINPFNGLDTMHVLANGEAFPATADNNHGWICKPETGQVRPDNTGASGNGVEYYDY